jgi:hypothetical protein
MANAIWYWIRSNVVFKTDEETMTQMGIPIINPTKELLIAPEALLRMTVPQGDCDDFTMLACTMLIQAGIKPSIITIAADREIPDKWSHVFCKASFHDGTSMMFDTSHGEYPGWYYKNSTRMREWII